MLARKKLSHYINNKFRLNLKIGALLLMTRKIRLSVKFGEKNYIGILGIRSIERKMRSIFGRRSKRELFQNAITVESQIT
jgi:hypothetical protein